MVKIDASQSPCYYMLLHVLSTVQGPASIQVCLAAYDTGAGASGMKTNKQTMQTRLAGLQFVSRNAAVKHQENKNKRRVGPPPILVQRMSACCPNSRTR